jgi:hypothetical protein
VPRKNEWYHCEAHVQLTCEVRATSWYEARIEAAKVFSKEHGISIGEQSVFALLQRQPLDNEGDSEDSPSE